MQVGFNPAPVYEPPAAGDSEVPPLMYDIPAGSDDTGAANRSVHRVAGW